MKILILYNHKKKKRYNHWGSVDYLLELRKYGHEVKFYGPSIEQGIHYEGGASMRKIRDEYKYDFLIINCYNRAYIDKKLRHVWIPEDNLPKILIEPDFHNMKNYSFLTKHNIKLMIHRHRSNYKRAMKELPYLNHELLYSSVVERIFCPKNKERIDKLCFVGTYGIRGKTYKIRQTAIDKLKGHNDFINCKNVCGGNYVSILNKYKIYLNGSSAYDIENTKAFEVLSSGGVLLTNKCSCALGELLEGNIVEYLSDCSDINEVLNEILMNKENMERLSINGRKIIIDKHTHNIRAGQLIEIIKKYEDLVRIK